MFEIYGHMSCCVFSPTKNVTIGQILSNTVHIPFYGSLSRAAVPNPRATDQYRSVGLLVLGWTEGIKNLNYFVVFIS